MLLFTYKIFILPFCSAARDGGARGAGAAGEDLRAEDPYLYNHQGMACKLCFFVLLYFHKGVPMSKIEVREEKRSAARSVLG